MAVVDTTGTEVSIRNGGVDVEKKNGTDIEVVMSLGESGIVAFDDKGDVALMMTRDGTISAAKDFDVRPLPFAHTSGQPEC